MSPRLLNPVVVAVALVVAGCAGGDGAAVDADPNAPDADPNAPDADPAAPDAGLPPPPTGEAALYPADRTLSPITADVAANLRAIAARGASLSGDVFAKVGASATVSVHFMQCFAGDQIVLDGRAELAGTIDYFGAGAAATTTPYERQSKAAVVGWSAGSALAGDPSPFQQEVDDIDPRYAVIMFGSNDIQQNDIYGYADNMLDLVDEAIGQGVIPLMTTIPPRDDNAAADAWVPRYNAVVRGVAQARQVPLMDFHRELAPLPDHGLGGDGLHPSVYRIEGTARPCHFDATGLTAGYNIRNLLTIQSLDRARAAVAGGSPPDATAPALAGDGSPTDPFVIEALPFGDLRDTRESANRNIDAYTGCSATQNEGGAEYVYRFDVATTTHVRAMVFDRGGVDIDVHLLSAADSGAACVERDHQVLDLMLAPGTHYFSLDTFVSGGNEAAGEYLFVLVEEP